MSDVPDEPLFEAEAVDADDIDVTKVDERLCNLEQFERSRSRWRQAALAFIVFSLLLSVMSFVQIWGTYASIKLVKETSEETERVKEQTAEQVRQLTETQEELRQMHRRLTMMVTMIEADGDKLKIVDDK